MTRDDESGTAFSSPSQARMLAEAIVLANTDAHQEAITATLRERYPGATHEACYGNPAAEAVMRRIKREQARAESYKVDLARLRKKGLPESLAKGGNEPEDEPVLSRPAYTESDQDDWRGPLHTEVHACKNVRELLALCERYDIHVTLDDAGVKLSRRIAIDSDLLLTLRSHKRQLIDYLTSLDAPLGAY